MTGPRLPLWIALVAISLAVAGRAVAQTPERPSKPFDRKYIDGSEYRDDGILLYDWPALSGLVVWSRRLESAVAEVDQTLSAELMSEFRARADSLRTAPRPAFLAGRADSIQTTLAAIDSLLALAEGSLTTVAPPSVTPKPGAASADPAHQRTIVTGNTAVTVPAGVAVGARRDSLPAVTIAGETVNFVDLVALALGELDRLVHLTRTAGVETGAGGTSPAPSDEGATPARETRPRRAAP